MVKKSFNLMKKAVRWYLDRAAESYALTIPSGMIPYNYVIENKDKKAA